MMKKFLGMLSILLPMTAFSMSPTSINMDDIPEEFKEYFYHATIPVQVNINDVYAFDGLFRFTEQDQILLIEMIKKSETQPDLQRWVTLLQQGLDIGQCEKSCPNDIISSTYSLDTSVLNIFTRHYEKMRVEKSNYLSLPDDLQNGIIIDNKLTATTGNSSQQNWNLNSQWLSSVANWTQKLSFYTSYTDSEQNKTTSSVYEAYTQKEAQGSFYRLGYFSPQNDVGNVSMGGLGYSSVIGAMIGSSDSLLIESESVSSYPIYVTGYNQSIAEVYRNDQLIYTQQLQPGVQAIDTRRLPAGIYNVDIRITVNGNTIDTQTAQVVKPINWKDDSKFWRGNLWVGQQKTIATSKSNTSNDNDTLVGGAVDVRLHPQFILGMSGYSGGGNDVYRLRGNITLSNNDTLFLQATHRNAASIEPEVQYFHSFKSGNAGLYWRRFNYTTTTDNKYYHSVGANVYYRLPYSTSLLLNSQYQNNIHNKGFNTSLTLNTQRMISGRNVTFRLSTYDKPGTNRNRDRGISLETSFSLFPNKSNHVSNIDVGTNDGDFYTNLNYSWRPENNVYGIEYLSSGINYSKNSTALNGNGGINNRYINGDFFVQQDLTNGETYGGMNLAQTLVIGGNSAAALQGNQQIESAMIIDVDMDSNTDGIMVTGNYTSTTLKAGKNIVPIKPWVVNSLQFNAIGNDNINVSPSFFSTQINKGSVQYLKISAVATKTLVAMLYNTDNQPLSGRLVSNGVGSAVVDPEGILTLEVSKKSKILHVEPENGQEELSCTLPETNDQEKDIIFISKLTCLPVESR